MDHVDARINLQDTFAEMPHKTASYGKYEVCFSSLAGLVHIGHGLVLAVYNLVVPGRHFFAPDYEDALTARHDVRPLQHLKLGMILLIPVIGSVVCWFFYYPAGTRGRALQYIDLAQGLLETNEDVLSEEDGELTRLDNGAFLYEFGIEEYREAGMEPTANDFLRIARSKFAELRNASSNDAQKQQILVVAARHPTLFPEGLGGVNEGQAAPQEGEGDVELLSTNINPFLQALNAYRQNPDAWPQFGGGRRETSHNSLSEESISSSSTESDEDRKTPPGNPPPPPSGDSNPPRSFNSNPLSEHERRHSWDHRRSAAGVDESRRLSSNAALSLHTSSVLRQNPPIPTPVPPARDASPTPSFSSSTSSGLSSSVPSLLSRENRERTPEGSPPPIPFFPSGGFGDLTLPDSFLEDLDLVPTSSQLDLLPSFNPTGDPRKLPTKDIFVAPGSVSPRNLGIRPNPAASVSSVAPSLFLSPSGLVPMDLLSATLPQGTLEGVPEERDNDFSFPSGGFSFTSEGDDEVMAQAYQLGEDGKHAEAAVLFEQIEAFSEAAESYHKAGNQDKVLECALKASNQNQPQSENFTLPEDFGLVEEINVDQLIEQGRYKEAAQACVAKGDLNRAGEYFELAGDMSQAAACVARTGDVGLCLAKSEEFLGRNEWSAARVWAAAAHKQLQDKRVAPSDEQLQQALSRLLECAIAENAAKRDSSALHKAEKGDRAAPKPVNSGLGFGGVTLRKTEVEHKATPTKKEPNEIEEAKNKLKKTETKGLATLAATSDSPPSTDPK